MSLDDDFLNMDGLLIQLYDDPNSSTRRAEILELCNFMIAQCARSDIIADGRDLQKYLDEE